MSATASASYLESAILGPFMTSSLNSVLGALSLGQFVCAVLFGITTLQTWIYFREHAKDPLLLRSLVFVLWILDCVHMALVMIAVYHYQVTNFENILILLKPHWSISSIPIVTTMTTGIIRGIFAYRLWKLGAGARTVPIIIIVASLFILGDATYFSAKEFFWPAWSSVSQYSWCLYAGFGCEIAVDSIITITQYQFMTRLQRGTTFRSTSSVVNLLVMYSINSCLLTGTCAVCTMIFFGTSPDTFIYIAFFCALSKLYINALLANLNVRNFLQKNLMKTIPRMGGTRTGFGTVSSFDATPVPDHISFGPSAIEMIPLEGRRAEEFKRATDDSMFTVV